MGFRLRLALFLVLTLAVVQGLTALLLYAVTRSELIAEGQRALGVSADVLRLQLDDVSQRVADSVEVLALDYALRTAIAQRDSGTVRSALRNHGRRVGATRMLLVDLDGRVVADSEDVVPAQSRFAYPDLLAQAMERRAAAVVVEDGRAWWMVVVPVLAPQAIAAIGAAIPIDDALLARLQQVADLPSALELLTRAADGRWQPVAHGGAQALLGPALLAREAGVDAAEPLQLEGREFLALARPLATASASPPLVAVLGSSLDDALRPYRPVASAWALLLALGFGVGLVGAVLIARGVSRPLERLATHARSIAAGDYRVPDAAGRRDEIGQLGHAFANMARAIGEREERIRYQLDHDLPTGLPNRLAAEAAIGRSLAAPDAQGALLLVGLARLAEITQTLGHAVSDRLMRSTGERLRGQAQGRLVARAADTQLLLWLPGALAEPYHEADITLDPAPTCGIALAPQHGATPGELLRHADVARYAVEASEERVAVYQPEADPHRPERLSLMADLREALVQDQLSLHFQPKWSLREARIDGAEGLVRWQHPRHGAIAPDTFIELAERTGNVRPLTRWVLAAGIAQAQRWLVRGHPWRVALNLSARDLSDRELPRRVAELLALHRLPAERLLLEITESAVMDEPDAALRVLQGLAEQGVDLAIDDFGVGHSSFAYLRRLPVREIKIDKSFAHRLGADAGDQAIVRAIVELGHRLGCKVTCEGVEDRAALDFLAGIGCDHAQGWAIARAVTADEFDRRFGNVEPLPAGSAA